MSEYEVLEEQDNHCHTFVYQVSVIFLFLGLSTTAGG
jgi:hypothetical protein